MIKVNLATKKRAASVEGGVKSGLMGIFSFGKGAGASDGPVPEQDLPLRKLIIYIAVGAIASFFLDDFRTTEIQKIDIQVKKLRGVEQELKTKLKKTKGYDQLKARLDKDEFTIRTKIDTIRKLLEDQKKIS